jgi:RsmE family RNA methyltransferase
VHINVERINRIVAEAAEQSGRAELMKINRPVKLKDILETRSTSLGNKRSEQSGQDYVFDITGTANVQNIIGGGNSGGAINLYFGPEGGWTHEELETFNRIAIDNSNFHIVKLGDFTMRAETAVAAGVARML